MRRSKFHPDAEAEFVAAGVFYDSKRNGSGMEFITEVERAVRIAATIPKAGTPFSKRLRRLLAQRFPYAIRYRIDRSTVLIIAVAHLHRRPAFWRKRM